jgi:hypothetical protein
MKKIKRISIFTLTLFGFFLLTFQDALSIDCTPSDAQGVNTNGTILGVGSGGMGSNVNIGDNTRVTSTRDTLLTPQQGQGDRGLPMDRVQSGQDIGSRFADREQRRGQQVQDRRTTDELRRTETGTRQPLVIPTPEGPQGSGGTKTTGGSGTTTGGTKTTGGTGTTTGGTGGTDIKTGGTQPPVPPKIPTTTEGTKTTGGTTTTTTVSQPSTISIRADSGHFIKINFTKGEGKSVKQETLQSGKYTEKMNVISCPDFTSYVDAAVNISVDIGSDEAYYIYTTRNIWDPTVRNLVVKRGVNINGKPVNEGDLKRITSEYNLYIDIFRKGSSISRTYFRLSGTK